MIFAEGEDGDLQPIRQQDLVRVWVWREGRLHSRLVMAHDSGHVIEANRRDGWHSWSTAAVLVTCG